MTATSIAIDIADKASNLLQKLKFKEANLEFISVFAQSIDEYDTYTEELLENGGLLAESSTGVFVKLERPLSTSLGGISILKVRKPSEDRASLGNVNYSVTDFQAFLNHYSNSDYFSVSNDSEGIKLATLEEPGSDYFIVVRESSLLDKLVGETENVSEYENDTANDDSLESSEANTNGMDSKVTELEQKLQEETNRRLNLMSDFQNYQKRIEGEKSLFGAMANMGIISSILEIHDDLELAMNDETLDLENAKHAMKTAQSKIVQTVASAGVEAILVKVGDEFNKDHMEAVSMIQAPNDEMKGKVIAVISSAYKYKDRDGVFKPAKVVVGK